MFKANNVEATIFALENFFQRIKTSLVYKLFKKLSQKNLKQHVPYVTLFALAELFTKNQDQCCVQVVYETFQHYFKANKAPKLYATLFSLVNFFQRIKLFLRLYKKIQMLQNLMPHILHLQNFFTKLFFFRFILIWYSYDIIHIWYSILKKKKIVKSPTVLL